MVILKKQKHLFFICFLVILSCFAIIATVSGFQHESKKFKAMLLTMTLMLLIIFLVYDVVYFSLLAYIQTILLNPSEKQRKLQQSRSEDQQTRSELLRSRIKSLKVKLQLTAHHRDESQNLYYKAICNDLWSFIRYFVLLLVIVVGSRNPQLYHNTNIITNLLTEDRILSQGIEKLNTLPELWDFIEVVLVEGFNEGRTYNGEIVEEPGWIHMEIAKLLGVVRMRQIRFKTQAFGLRSPEFDEEHYLPGWQKPYKKYHYRDKYWRTYEPWIPKTDFKRSWLLPKQHEGYLYIYPEYKGYTSVLARSKQNSLIVFDFLSEHKWLDNLTGAVFFDFTLYNVDSNLFSIVKVLVEKTQFGGLESHVDVKSAQLLLNIENLSYLELFILLLYVLQLLQFVKMLIMRAWYEQNFFASAWNIFDTFIILLNVSLFTMIYIRERNVVQQIAAIESAGKTEFVDFRIAAQMDAITVYIAGFLIAFTTIRIWKILQFDKCFMLFTTTLRTSFVPLASILIFIILFQAAFSLSTLIINRNNSENFLKLDRSIASCLSFTLGFNEDVKTSDLDYGGKTLGFVFYTVLMVAVSIFLFNIFITLLIDYGRNAKNSFTEIQKKIANQLSFQQFLRMEYSWMNCLSKTSNKFKLDKDMTVRQKIENEVMKMEKSLDMQPGELETTKANSSKGLEEATEKETAKTERLNITAQILNLQMELLKKELLKLENVITSMPGADSKKTKSKLQP